MKTKRKALAILLTLCMVLTMLPATAMAAAGEGLLGETLPEPAVCTMTADCGAAEHDEGCLSQAGPEGIAPLDGAAATPEAITTTPEAVTTTPEAVETWPEHVTVTPEGMDVPENDMIDWQTAETLNAVSGSEADLVTFYIDKGNIVLGEGTASGYDLEGNLITSVSAVGYRIMQSADTTANTIVIESGNPEIILDQVTINSGSSPSIWIKSGRPVLWLQGENSLNSNRANHATVQVDGGAGVIIDSEKAEGGTINENIPSTEPVSGKNRTLPQTSYAGSLTVGTPAALSYTNCSAGIGSRDARVKSQGMQIEIRGGNITAYSSPGYQKDIGTAIGVGGSVDKSNATSAVTIAGGNVYTETKQIGIGIGGRDVNIDLTGGTIYSVVTAGTTGSNRAMAIGGITNDITIGKAGDTENSGELNVVGIGKGTASGIGGVSPKIAIHAGNVYAKADDNAVAIGANHYYSVRSIEITGGTVCAKGASHAIGSYGTSDAPITIDGGSVDLTGKTGSSRGLTNSGGSAVSRTSVLVQAEDGAVLSDTEVTLHSVTDDRTWTARTDESGYLYPYLPVGTTIFTTNGSAETAVCGGASNSIGARCTCENGGTISLDTADRISVHNNTEDVDSISVTLSGSLKPAEDCKVKIHNGVLYEASTTAPGVPAPKIEGSVLTVYEAEQSYEITVKVINGQNDKCYAEKPIMVVIDKEIGFSIAGGSITASLTTRSAIEGSEEPIREITYRQGDRSVTIPESEKFVIEGASSANTIVIESGNPNIVLDQVSISSGNSPSIRIKSGCPVLWLKGKNSLSSNRATYATLQVDDGAAVIIDSEKDEAGMINEKIPATEPVSGEAHTLPQTKYAGSLTVDTPDILGSGKYAPGIGARNDQVKSQGMQIEIRGGNITAYASDGEYEKTGTAIGVGGSLNSAVAACAVTITGGNVYTEVRSKGVGIGGRNVTIDLTGGTIYSVMTLGNTSLDRAAAIGGTNNDITIGTAGDTENSRELNVVGIGMQTASGIGGVNPKIAIHSGNVYAYGDKNAAAIGGNFTCSIRSIEITGGEIWTKGVTTSIGVRSNSAGYPKTGGPVEIAGGNIQAEGALGSSIKVPSAVTTVTVGSGAALNLTGPVGAPLENNSSETTITGDILNDITVNAPTQVTGSLAGTVTVTSGGALDVDGSIKEGESNHVTVESGGSLSVSGSVQTDVTNTGETNIGGNVDGNVTSESGSTVIGGNVTGDLNAAGGTIAVGGDVGGDKNTGGATEESIAALLFDMNDGKGTIAASVIRREGDERPLAEEEIPTPERINYCFEGWNIRIDGMGTPVNAGMEIRGRVTVYAQWTATDEYKLAVAQSTLTDGTIVIGNGADKTEAVREYAKSLMTSTMFMGEGGVVSVSEEANGEYAVTLTLNGQSVVKNLKMTITETEKTTEQLLAEALEALNSIAAEITGAYSDMELDLMTKAVDEILRGTDFYKMAGRTIEVVGASGAFTVTLELKGQTGTKEMQTAITLASPATDGEKAAYAINGMENIELSFHKGTSDAEVIAAAKEKLMEMTTPYENAGTEIIIALISGIDRYRVTARVGGETASKVVRVTPVYEGYEPGQSLEGRITGNTDVVLSNDTERNGTALIVELTGTPAGTVSYQWQKRSESGWINVTDGRTETLTLSLLTMADDGAQYQCVVTHKVPDTQPAAATLTAAALTVKKGDWPAPDLTVTRPENESGTGSIAGLTTEMEIRQGEGEQAGEWTMVSESQAANGITEIPYGTVYQARYAETDYVNAGPVKTIRFVAGVTVSGQVSSYNPGNATTVTLYASTDTAHESALYTAEIAAETGNGQTTQSFTVNGVAAGTYDLVVSKGGHLDFIITGVVVGMEPVDLTQHSNSAISTIALLAGDIDGNGTINLDDLNTVWNAANYDNESNQAANKRTDINGNGFVNVDDLNLVWNEMYYDKNSAVDCTVSY